MPLSPDEAKDVLNIGKFANFIMDDLAQNTDRANQGGTSIPIRKVDPHKALGMSANNQPSAPIILDTTSIPENLQPRPLAELLIPQNNTSPNIPHIQQFNLPVSPAQPKNDNQLELGLTYSTLEKNPLEYLDKRLDKMEQLLIIINSKISELLSRKHNKRKANAVTIDTI